MLSLSEILLESGADEVRLKKVGQNLREWGLCTKCILRFMSVKNQDFYQFIDADKLNNWLDDFSSSNNSSPPSKADVCTACLGILQNLFCNGTFISQIVEMVNKQGFEFNDFYCALSLPVSLLIREHSVYVAVNEMYPDIFEMVHNNLNNSNNDRDRGNVAAIKEVWKWINGPELSRQLGRPFNQKSSFEVQIHFEYKNDDRECGFLRDLSPKDFQKRKKSCTVYNRNNITKILKESKCADFKKFCKVPMSRPLIGCHCEVVVCSNQSLFVAGRYNKYSRTLSQTPWYVDGLKKFENSVEEILCKPIAELFMTKDYKFSSSGREDVDVRMLGKGRPFLIEILNPKKINIPVSEFRRIEEAVNRGSKDVFIRDVQLVTKEDTRHLKEGEEEKVKMYKALCIMKGRIHDNQLNNMNNMKNIVLQQKTPIRVLHRRPLATRLRTVHELKIELINIHEGTGAHLNINDENVALNDYAFELNHSVKKIDNNDNKVHSNNNDDDNDDEVTLFILNVTTQAGTYVKEFVHGDFGRTLPNLSTLLGRECDILQLDVGDVLLNWPPPINYN